MNDRYALTQAFTTNNIPNWKCPTCQKGALIGNENDFYSFESSESSAASAHSDWSPDWVWGFFYGHLWCNNNRCNEKVLIAGDSKNDFDPTTGDFSDVVEYLMPNYFNPTLRIFDIDPSVPEEIEDSILKAFKLYWVDSSSCANKIRIIAEQVLSYKKKYPKLKT